MNLDRIIFPKELYYDKKHGWANLEDTVVTQGLTDFGQLSAGQIVFVKLPILGKVVEQGKAMLSIESGKWVGRLPAIVSGKVIAVNEYLRRKPQLINESPYEQGWLVKIEITNPQEIGNLMRMDTKVYLEFMKAEFEK